MAKKVLRFISIFLMLLFVNNIFVHNQNSPIEIDSEKYILSNGLSVIYNKDLSSSLTEIKILIKGGKKADPKGKAGLAYLTTYTSLEVPDRNMIQELMDQASRVYMSCENDFSLIHITSLSKHIEKTLEIIVDILTDPIFSSIRIERSKDLMIQRRIIKEDDSIQLGHHTSLDSYFKDTVYEGNIFGNEKSLKLIKKKDIVHFYKKYFKAGNMILSVSSNIEKELLMEILQKYFSRFPKGTSTVIQTASGSIPENKTINVKKDSKQSFISLSFLLPELTQRNFILSFMLKYFLGKGPGSKLWELREERNLAYNVNCRVTWMKGGGILEVYIESDRCKKDISLQAINKIITDLYKNGITKEEFTEMKTYAKSSFLRSIETKNKRTYYMAFFEAMGLSHKFITLFLKEIDSVSLVDTNNYINKILVPSKMVEIIIGPGYYEEQT